MDKPLIGDVRAIIETSRRQAVRSIDTARVQMYWHIGRRIVEEEQGGQTRADYGKYIIRNLAAALQPEYGSGFGVRQLETSRQFFLLYPNAHTLCAQLNWSQYKLLVTIADKDKREYYELEAVNNAWTFRQLKRQVDSLLYERLLMSNDKEAVLAVARGERQPERPEEVIKDPMVLEFLGLECKPAYYERDLEGALLTHISDFLLELGRGFTFVARQKRLLIEDDEFFADLVFYNRLMRCFVVIELKTGRLTHQDLGQLQMYVNYYDRHERQPDENPTIGILLCTDKNDTAVRMTLPADNTTILASRYQLYLPTIEQLEHELEEARRIEERRREEEA